MYCWSNFHFFPLELTIKGSSALSFCSTSLPRSESLGGHLRSSRHPPFSSMRFRKPSSQPITCNKHAADIITHVYIYMSYQSQTCSRYHHTITHAYLCVTTITQTLSTNKQQISSHMHICCSNHTGCQHPAGIIMQSHMHICCNNHTGSVNIQQASSHNHTCTYYICCNNHTGSVNTQQASSHMHIICCNNHTGSVNIQQASSHNHTCIYVVTITQALSTFSRHHHTITHAYNIYVVTIIQALSTHSRHHHTIPPVNTS